MGSNLYMDSNQLKKINHTKSKIRSTFTTRRCLIGPISNDTYIDKNGLCHGLKDQIAILHDGSVTACCLDSCGINKIGDLNTNSLKEILDSNLYKETLIALNNKKLLLPLCKHCTYRLRFNK